MPSTLPTPDRGSNGTAAAGTLYVVATPIGNLEDVTLRALRILGGVGAIAAEDTRHTKKLLSHHGINTRLISLHEHNERTRVPELIRQLEVGDCLALVTDAGTPAVSDPGYRLVSQAVTRGISVVPVPGVSAVITALSVGGLPTDSFVFVGFPAKKQGQRIRQLQGLAREPRTLVFYESPRRLIRLLTEIHHAMGERRVVLGREMTKLHEEFLRGRISSILTALGDRPMIKGECTLLVEGSADAAAASGPVDSASIETAIGAALAKGASLADASREVAGALGVSRRRVYDLGLKLSSGKNALP
jgi:16S rRNA (cytidine1402-2'-O)-methyltransferase